MALLPASFVSYHRNRVNMSNAVLYFVVVRLLTKLAVMFRRPAEIAEILALSSHRNIEVATCIVARKRSLTRDCLFECSDGTLITVISRSGIDQNAWLGGVLAERKSGGSRQNHTCAVSSIAMKFMPSAMNPIMRDVA